MLISTTRVCSLLHICKCQRLSGQADPHLESQTAWGAAAYLHLLHRPIQAGKPSVSHQWLFSWSGFPAWIRLWRRWRWASAVPTVWDTKLGSARPHSHWTAFAFCVSVHIFALESTDNSEKPLMKPSVYTQLATSRQCTWHVTTFYQVPFQWNLQAATVSFMMLRNKFTTVLLFETTHTVFPP